MVGPSGARTFRVAEDGSLADVRDASLELPAGATVRVAHPVELPGDERAAWAGLFADYAILQPFEQLGRAVASPTPKERRATALERVAGRAVSAPKALGILESRGFRRASAGEVGLFLRDAVGVDGARLVVRLSVSPGCDISDLAHAPPQTTRAATVVDARGAGVALGALSARDFSELVRDGLALGA